MYLDRFGFERPPFEETTSPRFCYETAAVVANREAVLLQLQAGAGVILITGESGTGRTMLGRLLAEHMPEDVRPVTITPSLADPVPLLERMAAALQTALPTAALPEALAAVMREAVRDSERNRYVVIVDDADQLSVEDLAGIEALIASAGPRQLAVTFVLLASDAIESMLRTPRLAQFAGVIRRCARLSHLPAKETGNYLAARLAAAGWRAGELFTPEAVERIARIAQGRMRQINALARQALIRADRRGLTCIDAEQIPEPAGDLTSPAPVGAALPEHRMDRTPFTSQDLERMERIIDRFAEIATAAPQRLADLDAGLTALTQRADTLLRDTTERIDRIEDSSARANVGEELVREQMPHLERLIGDAQRAQSRLDEFVHRLADIDAASEERIALLLSGLESATTIHDKLESAGQQVGTLIEEARHTALAERENLVKVFDELSARREELSATIDTLRHQRQAALEEHEAAIGSMLQRCRADAAQACTASAEALAEARRTVEANRAALAEQAGAAGRKVADARDACTALLAQVHSAQADVEARQAALTQLTARFDERMSSLAAATERSGKLNASAHQAADRLVDVVAQAQKANQLLGHNIDTAAHLRDNCIATLERLQGDGVRALEQTSSAADQRLSDALARFETLVATEQKARASAEEAVRSARSALAAVQQSEAKLADAQAAAINIEATASAALTAVQQQIKHFESAVDVIVKHGVDRARAEIVALLDDCSQRVEGNTALVENTTDGAIKRLYGEITAAQAKLAAEQAAVLQDVATAVAEGRAAVTQTIAAGAAGIERAVTAGTAGIEEAITAGAAGIDEAIAAGTAGIAQAVAVGATEIKQTIEAGEASARATVTTAIADLNEASAEAAARIADASTTGREALDRDMQQASAALHAAFTNAVTQVDSRIAAGCETIERDVTHATTAIQVACRNAQSQTEQDLARRHEEICRIAADTTERFETETELFAALSRSAIEETASEAQQKANEQISGLAAGALQSLEGEIEAAQASAEKLALMADETRKILLEAGTVREQIDHQIRDVWSLTATTDQRVRELNALTDRASASEKHLGELIAGATRQSRALATQADGAHKSVTALAAHHEQVKGLAATIAERIADARKACTAITEANATGQQLAPQLRGWIEDIQSTLTGAQALRHELRGEKETLATHHEAVQQLTLVVGGIEQKIASLQEALASPIAVIQDARSQAEELNEVCLAVKRVFRSVSQASLQANERIKLLGKLLVATERSAQSMKQWVEEASKAQARLSGTLAIAPHIQDTHLLVPLEIESPRVVATMEVGAHVAADDKVTIQRAAQSRRAATVAVANESAQPRPIAASGRPGSVAKTVVPLVDVLKAKQAKANGERLRPEDVQSMIDAARQTAPTGP